MEKKLALRRRLRHTNEPRRNVYNRSWREEAIDAKGYRSHLRTLQNNDDPFFPSLSLFPSTVLHTEALHIRTTDRFESKSLDLISARTILSLDSLPCNNYYHFFLLASLFPTLRKHPEEGDVLAAWYMVTSIRSAQVKRESDPVESPYTLDPSWPTD